MTFDRNVAYFLCYNNVNVFIIHHTGHGIIGTSVTDVLGLARAGGCGNWRIRGYRLAWVWQLAY